MNLSNWRHFVCLSVIAILPASLLADDAGAVLRSSGSGVLVNKNSPPASVVLFSGDLIETQKDAVARIEASGSAVNINPETMVQFEGGEVVLEHGSLSVNTTHGLKVRVGCLTIVPENTADWTHYDVADVNGKVVISAVKNNVAINPSSSKVQQAKQSVPSIRLIVREGERESREENCGAPSTTPASAANGSGLNSPWVVGAGAAGIGVLLCVALCRGSEPISPSQP